MKHFRCAIIALCCLLMLAACSPAQGSPNETHRTDGTTAADTASTEAVTTEAVTTEGVTNTPSPVNGSFSTDAYSVTDIDGICYMNFADGNELTDHEKDVLAQEIGYISFVSIDEMYDQIRNSKLTDEQIAVIKNAFTKNKAGIVFPNINDLQIPVLPSGLQPVRVGLTNDEYTFSVQADAGQFGCGAKFMSEDQYRVWYEKDYLNYFENEKLTVLSTTESEFEGIPCEIAEVSTRVATLRLIRFQICEEGKTMSVQIKYALEHSSPYVETSETVPRSITVFCEQNGKYMQLYMYNLEATPTLDWLKSFGIVPYAPPADTLAGN